jgi:hypothetical protein
MKLTEDGVKDGVTQLPRLEVGIFQLLVYISMVVLLGYTSLPPILTRLQYDKAFTGNLLFFGICQALARKLGLDEFEKGVVIMLTGTQNDL